MNREELIQSAARIPPVPSRAAEEYARKQQILVANINEMMMQRPGIHKLIGEKNTEMMKDNHSNHARFVASILRYSDPEVLTDTVLWVFRAYTSRGFHPDYRAAQINSWIRVLRQELAPETFAAVYPLYEWLRIRIPAFCSISRIPPQWSPGHDF